MLEAENTLLCSNKLRLLKEQSIEDNGKANYPQIVTDWKKWVDKDFVEFIKKKYNK